MIRLGGPRWACPAVFLASESALDVRDRAGHGPWPRSPVSVRLVRVRARERGTAIHKTVFPYGPTARARFTKRSAAASANRLVREREKERGRRCEREPPCAGGRSRFARTRWSNCRWRARCARPARACSSSRTPNISAQFPRSRDGPRLDGVEILEHADRFDVFAKLVEPQPDLVVANLNIANPLEGMGFDVKWSTELTFQPIHGFSGARRCSACSPRRCAATRRWPSSALIGRRRDADRPLVSSVEGRTA